MRLGRTGRFVYGRRSLIFGLWAGDESLICLRRQSREQVRPLVLASFVRDQVLANFDCHMMQIALFAVNGEQRDLHHVAIEIRDRKSTRLNSSHANISYAVFCLKKKKKPTTCYIFYM